MSTPATSHHGARHSATACCWRSSSCSSIVMIAPVLWVIGLSLKDNAELMADTELGVSRALYAEELHQHPSATRRCSAGCSTASSSRAD